MRHRPHSRVEPLGRRARGCPCVRPSTGALPALPPTHPRNVLQRRDLRLGQLDSAAAAGIGRPSVGARLCSGTARGDGMRRRYTLPRLCCSAARRAARPRPATALCQGSYPGRCDRCQRRAAKAPGRCSRRPAAASTAQLWTYSPAQWLTVVPTASTSGIKVIQRPAAQPARPVRRVCSSTTAPAHENTKAQQPNRPQAPSQPQNSDARRTRQCYNPAGTASPRTCAAVAAAAPRAAALLHVQHLLPDVIAAASLLHHAMGQGAWQRSAAGLSVHSVDGRCARRAAMPHTLPLAQAGGGRRG
jgi:hypothetical protein